MTTPEVVTQEPTNVEAPAVPTPQERLEALDLTIRGKYDLIVEAVTSGGDISSLTIEYASMTASRKVLLREANHDAINDEMGNVATAVTTVLDACNLATLMDEEITSLFWERTPGSGENGPVINLVVNKAPTRPVTRKPKEAATGTPATSTNGSKAAPDFTVDGSQPMTARAFVDAHAPQEVREAGQFKSGKFPTRPDFLDKTQEYLENQGHIVVRFSK